MAGYHILSSLGYPEWLGFRNAETIWKAHQLSILPSAVKEFSDQAQKSGMKTLFSLLPGLKMEGYLKTSVWLVGGILTLLGVHMGIYLISLRWRETLLKGSPVKNFSSPCLSW